MTAVIRSLADSLRLFGDDRLEALLLARPDLAAPLPNGIGPLAARAAGPTSARRALESLTLPELHLVEALAVLPDGTSPAELAAAVSAEPAEITTALERLETLALVWGEDELRLVRPLREGLRTPAGLAPAHEDDPAPVLARHRVDAARERLGEVLETLAWGPAEVQGTGRLAEELRQAGIVAADADGALRIPRTVHLALRGGRVRRSFVARRPQPEGPEITERISGSRAAQAVERAFEALRILGTVRDWDDDPPGVLRRGGIPQRDLRRLADRADAPLLDCATVLQTAWQDGLIGHDGQEWHPTRDWDSHRSLAPEQRWAELALAWARGHHLAAVVGTPDSSGTGRALLSDLTRRDGVRSRRASLLRALETCPALDTSPESLQRSLAWAFPLVPADILAEEVEALRVEGRALGLLDGGCLTLLGQELVRALDEPVTTADERLATALREAAPPPVEEVLLGADLTAVIPGRPAETLLPLLDWTDVVSRGGALTLRFTAESVRRALGSGRDPLALLELLDRASRTPLPQALEYLLQDEQRRHGRVRIARATTVLTAEAEVLDLLQVAPEAKPLDLHRLAPTVATTLSDPGFALQIARRAGLSPQAVGPDGRPAAAELPHELHAPAPAADLVTVDGPELRLPPAEAVARIRAAEEGQRDLSVTDRLLEAIAQGQELALGIVDGRGGVAVRQALPLSLEGGRLRARVPGSPEEFTVLVHRVTLG
ncbi:helicase-associated domain-containing protein [Brachybacterium sp. J144]|uniref:helicase-associated domain-containing protein n=1 Tax=Brachybacterium sp. J144 TaxID=3116487 RepID=UPI002E781555|nr:helicase-associated domain-containing protein [Brachybacterium sp. J144]MEE1651602.1 helicase-associated domain-containing protein [Brachybacterium sp. J144]